MSRRYFIQTLGALFFVQSIVFAKRIDSVDHQNSQLFAGYKMWKAGRILELKSLIEVQETLGAKNESPTDLLRRSLILAVISAGEGKHDEALVWLEKAETLLETNRVNYGEQDFLFLMDAFELTKYDVSKLIFEKKNGSP